MNDGRWDILLDKLEFIDLIITIGQWLEKATVKYKSTFQRGGKQESTHISFGNNIHCKKRFRGIKQMRECLLVH